RGASRHNELDHLALGRQRRSRKRGRRDAEPGDDAHLVVDDQLLGKALGVVRYRRIVLKYDLDLAARDRIAVLFEVEIDGGLDLLAGRRLLAGHRQDQADFKRILRPRRARYRQQPDRKRGLKSGTSVHGVPPSLTLLDLTGARIRWQPQCCDRKYRPQIVGVPNYLSARRHAATAGPGA